MRRLIEGRIGTKVLAADRPTSNECLQRFGSCMTAAIECAFRIQTLLVNLGRIDAIEPVALAIHLDGVGILSSANVGWQEQKPWNYEAE